MSRFPHSSRLRVAGFGAAIAILALVSACSTPVVGPIEPGSLRFIGEQKIAHRQAFGSTTVGGLSGLDYDAKTDTWVIVSDDRSDINPARFYTARLRYDEKTFDSVELLSTTPLRQDDGTPYPSRAALAKAGGEPVDAESIRIDPRDRSVWYTSEGDRTLAFDPFVKHAQRDGKPIERIRTPEMFKMSRTREVGSRNNDSYESLSFSTDGNSLWVAMEAPTYEDGPLPSVEQGAFSRITQYSREGAVMRQVAYPIGPIPGPTTPGKSASNGIAEILAVDADRFLVLERSGVAGDDGAFVNHIRLFEMNVADASDVRGMASLKSGATFRPASRRLVLDLMTLGLPKLDNIEGLAWGPKLKNGHDSLMLVSDDNFNPGQITQFLAFEVMPPKAE